MPFMNPRKTEIALLFLAWGSLFSGLYLTAGGPVSWDELLYMETSWNLKEVPWILNRYTHIYFQSLFMHLVGDPLEGSKIYWSFLISSSLAGTYLAARLLASHSRVLTGLIAVILFCHLRLPFRYSGTPYADFCLMFLGTWSAVVFLLACDRGGIPRRVLLILLGLFLLLAVKSKEHGIVYWTLLLALGRIKNEFSWQTLKRDLLWVILGGLSGGFCIIIADTIALGNPLYSLWPGNVESVLDYNAGLFEERSPDSWLRILTAQTLALPFLLYLAAPFVSLIENWTRKVVWSIPILFVLFLTIIRIFIRFELSDRQLINSLPLLCAGASLFFQPFLGGLHSRETRLRMVIFTLSILPALFVIVLKLPERIAATWGWTSFPLESAVIFPVGAFLLLLLAAWFRQQPNHSVVFAIAFVFWLAALPGVKANLSNLYHDTAGKISRERFLPYKEFEDFIPVAGQPRFLVSPEVYSGLGMLGRSAESCSWMFDLYFKTDTQTGQFVYEEPDRDRLLSGDYNGIFLTKEEFEHLQLDGCGYTIYKAEESELVFLKKPTP